MTGIPRRVAATVAENIVFPVGIYFALTATGAPPVWALVGGAAASVMVLAVRFLRTGQLTTLGLLVLGRFALDIAVAAITGDPRLQLAKDFAITGVIGLVAATSLCWRYPLLARIRRDLAEPAEKFTDTWNRSGDFRALHMQLTSVWAVGLVIEAVVGILLVYGLPLNAAVVATSILSPATLFGLIAWTQHRARRWSRGDAAHTGVRGR
jgi:hypothetical protein